MIVSHRYGFVFLRSRRTGGTSIHLALSEFIGPEDISTPINPRHADTAQHEAVVAGQNWRIPRSRWGPREWLRPLRGKQNAFWEHTRARTARRYLPQEVWDTYYRFAFDRNPWDLIASAYFRRRDRSIDQGNPPPSFQEFALSDGIQDYRNWPIYTIDDQVIVDDLFPYGKDLTPALEVIADRTGLPHVPSLPHVNSTRHSAETYQALYDPASRERIAEVFAPEIELFGWTFD